MSTCFHCGEALPAKSFQFKVLGEMRELCCMGCYAVTEAIVSAGLEHYYQERDVISPTAPLPESLTILQGYDHPNTQQQFLHREQDLACAELSVEGVSCAACAWLIERRLAQEPSVKQATVNLSSHRLRLLWDDSQAPLSQLLADLEQLGYRARPFRTDTHAQLLKQESRQLLMRLGVAALGSMQAMMYAGSLYFATDMTDTYRDFFRWTSLVVTTPIFFYSGYPFYRSAWYALKARTLNMDSSVSIALIISFFASIYAMLTGAPHVYFDSVSMFIFFLLAGRYLEAQARQQASQTANDLIPIMPRLSHRLLANGDSEEVPVSDLHLGEHIIVKAGEIIPCDGLVLEGHSAVSEALLTGEPLPIDKNKGDSVVSGSQNHDSPLVIEILRTVQSSTLATIHQLMNRALAEKPLLAQRADHIAHWFVLIILVLSAVVYGAWYVVNPDPEYALLATIAVLVATCPCALSLATPVALTTATNQLAQQGFLITRGHVLETLAQATHIIFDKTGTLTEGKLELAYIKVFAELDELAVKTIAAALEQYSEHPVALAFKRLKLADLPLVSETTNLVGSGLTGIIDGKCYLIGHDLFALGREADAPAEGFLRIWLSLDHQPLASFDLRDKVRPNAEILIQQLKKQGLTTVLLSGDRSQSPQLLGQALAIDDIQGGLSPTDKAQYVQNIQARGAIVVMVGDGINDAPVLGQSHLSVAMASGADLAQTTADAILLSDKLAPLVRARQLAIRTQVIVKQNLYWAFVYNLAILPPAALGYIPPWVAAIGMSLSSLFVVLNALRLKRTN